MPLENLRTKGTNSFISVSRIPVGRSSQWGKLIGLTDEYDVIISLHWFANMSSVVRNRFFEKTHLLLNGTSF